ncbi:hypothetical protein GY45DRAFT_200475 [Cubamyces sp. BRFM 1775]|nr:hypothetical protein GY45DRAFT_200475 [Cubamyces sp. BRFM 1775]
MGERPGSTGPGNLGAREIEEMTALPTPMLTENTTPITRHEGEATGRDERVQEPELGHANALGLDDLAHFGRDIAHMHGDIAQPTPEILWPWDEARTIMMQYADTYLDSRLDLPIPPQSADRSEWPPSQGFDHALGGEWGQSEYNSDTQSSPRRPSVWVELPLEDSETGVSGTDHPSLGHGTNTRDHREATTQSGSSKEFVLIGTTRSGYPSLHSPFSDPQGNIDRPAQLWGSVQRSPTARTLPLYHGMSSASQSAAARGE